MNTKVKNLIDKLYTTNHLSKSEYIDLISLRDSESAEYLRTLADAVRQKIYGNSVFVRGLIEISNYCKNDCLYLNYGALTRQSFCIPIQKIHSVEIVYPFFCRMFGLCYTKICCVGVGNEDNEMDLDHYHNHNYHEFVRDVFLEHFRIFQSYVWS